MMNEILTELWAQHRGKILGVAAGVGFSCCILAFGFWRSLFVVLCAVLGYFIGKRIDEKGGWRDFYNRMFPER